MKAADVLARAYALFLDFDGPICAVFAGVPASTVANQLRNVLGDGGYVDFPEAVRTSADPFDVLRHAATLGEDEARLVESAFAAHEIEAISTAAPTEGAHTLIRSWHATGRPTAIVSNNSTLAINAYLDLYDLRAAIDVVSARKGANIALLKPNSHFIRQAITALDISPSECVFIGDSPSDVEAARAANVLSIGYANKPGKAAKLIAANAITDTMVDLITVG